jgi:hypothetical protein
MVRGVAPARDRLARPDSERSKERVIQVRVLKSVTFAYKTREDRILAAINPGAAEAWSCWLTRRLVLALLERAAEFLASTSTLAQRAPAGVRGEVAAFEREAAIVKTARSMSHTPANVISTSATAAELAERLTITNQGETMRLELHGESGGGAAAVMARAELQRILQMLQVEVARAGWSAAPVKAPAPPAAEAGQKPGRH